MAGRSGHFIVCGYGRVGMAVAHALSERSTKRVVIGRDERTIAEAEEQGFLCVSGDSTIDDNLAAAQVR